MFCNNIFIVENILIGTFLYCCWNKEKKKKSFLKRFKCCISCSGTRICSTVCYHDSFGVITKELWQFTKSHWKASVHNSFSQFLNHFILCSLCCSFCKHDMVHNVFPSTMQTLCLQWCNVKKNKNIWHLTCATYFLHMHVNGF